MQRQIDEDNWQQQLSRLHQQPEEEKKNKEREWATKEETILQKEKAYAEARQKVKQSQQLLESEIKKAREEGKAIAIQDAKTKLDVREKEIQGERLNYELKIKELEGTIAENQQLINGLSKQLEVGLKQVQDLAVKAIEGASSRDSFEAIKEIALEQAKNQPKGK